MFADTLGYPTRGEHANRTLLVGGILSAFWLFVLPLVLVVGYGVGAARATFAGRSAPPAFDGTETLAKDGVVGCGVVLVYMLVPVVLTTAAVVVTGGLGLLSGDADLAVLSVLASLFVGFAVGVVTVLAFGYVAFAAVVNYARTGEPSAAFDVGTLASVVASGAYLEGYVVAVVSVVLGSIVAFALNFVVGLFFGVFSLVPIVGLLFSLLSLVVQWTVASFVGFYVTLGSFRAGALGVRGALDS